MKKILTLSLLLLASSALWAVDSDGDGVDDSIDAFPADPCGTIDTDGDGKPNELTCLWFYDGFDGVHLGPAWTQVSNTTRSDYSYIGLGSVLGGGGLACSLGAQKNIFSITLAAPGELVFYVINSLWFKVDGNDRGTYYGSMDGTLFSWPLSAGSHTIEMSGGCQSAVDEVYVIPATATLEWDYDDDNNGILDAAENPPAYFDPGADTDQDGINNSADTDDDNDGVIDASDLYPLDTTRAGDLDGDGLDALLDNCPAVANAGQQDSDVDSIGNACDTNPLAQAGSRDSSFQPAAGANLGDTFEAVAVQANGQVLVGGNFTKVGSATTYRLARLNSDGSLDSSYAPRFDNTVYRMALQPDGRLLVAGYFTTVSSVTRNRIARLMPDGQLDSSFNPGTGLNNWVYAMALQPDGKIVAAGAFTTVNGTARNRMARLNTDGSLDSSFDPGVGVGGANPFIEALLLQADGRLVIGGPFTSVNGTTHNHIARLNADGSLDNSFNPGSGASGPVYALAAQADGKIIMAGNFTSVNGTARNRIARLNVDGSLDNSFNPGSGFNDTVNGVQVQADGKIVAVGNFSSVGGVGRNHIARLQVDGSLDSSFDPGAGTNAYVSPIAFQPDGKILIGGSFIVYNSAAIHRVARINSGDTDGDATQDAMDVFAANDAASRDTDSDGFPDVWNGSCDATCQANSGLTLDNCPSTSNADQLNTDGDSQGDICDADDDNDGWTDTAEGSCGTVALDNLSVPEDTDGDLSCNAVDADDDNDLMPDTWEELYGLDTLYNDAGDDMDSDGFTNLQEYQNGTDPYVADLAAAVKNDFDKDGDGDLFWRDSASGSNVVWILQGGLKVGANVLGSNATAYTVEAIADFDGDRDSDVLFRNNSTGQSVIWTLESGVKAGATVLGTNAATYSIKGVADFDNDGDADILFRDTTGNNLVWTIQNAAKVGAVVLGANASTYTVEATEDFDADGDADILFRDNTSGQSVIWRMQNNAKVGAVVLGTNASTYSIKGVADFNNDGDADILFRDTAGNNVVWTIQNAAKTGAVTLGSNSNTHSVAATADFDNDGDADILFRDTAGNNLIWVMQNHAKASASVLGANAATYSVAGTGDADGDGDEDILFRNGSTGANVLWMIQANAKAAANVLSTNASTMEAKFGK